jgi:DNA-binding LacI/PurR family transcriptional regulator
VLDALSTTLDAHDHSLLLLPGLHGGPRAERLLRVSADVAIAYGLPDDMPAVAAAQQRGLPLVVIDSPVIEGGPRVEVDDGAGAAAAARHLLDLGHRAIGILSFELRPDGRSGPVTQERVAAASYRTTRERLSGFIGELAASAETATSPIWESPGNHSDLGRDGARWLLTHDPRPTALLCTSDELALGALMAARDLGLSVPADLSVVGFDDVPTAKLADPPLTTVRQPLAIKGRQAAELALGLLAGHEEPGTVRLPTELVVRGSTAPTARPIADGPTSIRTAE